MEEFLSSLEDTTYQLSALDIIPSHLYITNALFFENASPSRRSRGDVFMPSDVLQSSLYDALQRFPILAGRLRRDGASGMRIVVEKAQPNLPVFEEYHTHLHFGAVRDRQFHRNAWPEGIHISDPRALSDASGSPKLVRVRVVRFSRGSGVALLVRISHSACDAKGCVSFMRCWAGLCAARLRRAGQLPSPSVPDDLDRPPLVDREILYRHLPRRIRPVFRHPADPRAWLWHLLVLTLRALLTVVAMFSGKNAAADPLESHLFCVPRPVLTRLSESASGLFGEDGRRISDNDMITAILTMAFAQSLDSAAPKPGYLAARCRRLLGLHNRPVSAIVPCDFRHRIGVPENYTGNCAIGLYVTAPRSRVLAPIGPESLARVARISRETVDGVDAATVEKFIVRAMRAISLVGDKARVLYSLMVCQAFSNQSRLGFYDVDFGFGSAVLSVPMAYPATVAVVVPPPPPSADVFVYLTLQPAIMAALLQNHHVGDFLKFVY